jgi:hypothetical protein
VSRVLAAILAMALLAVGPQAGAADLPSDSCPLVAGRYRATPVQARLSGAVGEKIVLAFTLDPPEPPAGFFLSVNMKAVEMPEPARIGRRPEVLTGFPDSTAVFRVPGAYRYRVVVSLIAKSSCGGVKADTVYSGDVFVDVTPR